MSATIVYVPANGVGYGMIEVYHFTLKDAAWLSLLLVEWHCL